MCTPEAYIASRVLQGYTQYNSDKARAKYTNDQAISKAETIREEAIYKDNALIRQKETKEDQLTEQKLKLKETETQKKGQVKLAVFEKGIGGNLFNSLVGDVERQAGKDSNIIDQNYENYMCAAIETNEKKIMSLRNYLSKKIPSYMIPKEFKIFRKLPTNSNGKIDRKKIVKIFN